MTRTSEIDSNGHRLRERTLGLPASSERALMARAYENYCTAQALHVAAHNDWRHKRRIKGQTAAGWSPTKADRNPAVRKALARATESALYLADAKAQYRQAKNLAFEAAA